MRNGAAEEIEVAEDELKEDVCASREVGPLGRGRRAKIRSTKYTEPNGKSIIEISTLVSRIGAHSVEKSFAYRRLVCQSL